MPDGLRIERRDAVMTITLDRPTKRNALTGAMYDGLREALAEADRDGGVGAVVLTGSNGCFTAGNDLGDFLSGPDGASRALRFIEAIATSDTPIVAAVDGNAVGVGTTMLFHCDLVYAAPSARFRMPFVDLGLVPEAASSLTVPMRVGLAKASEWLLLGDAFDAEEAYRCGVVNRVVPAAELLAVARSSAERLAAKPRGALASSRRLIRGERGPILARIAEESHAFQLALASPEAKAAFAAFLSKTTA